MTPVFTSIIFAWRPKLLARSMDALLNQTRKDIEILLVDNYPAQDSSEIGHEITEMVEAFALKDRRIRVLSIPRKKYSFHDVMKNYDECCDLALKEARGQYIMYQNDDDYIASDYIEKMVNLFEENPKCISATGLPVAVDVRGNEIDVESNKRFNHRPRFMNGHEMALDVARGGTLFNAPGMTVFAFKKNDYIRLGGHPKASDIAHLYGIIAFGETGFDPSAKFFWLRHQDQFNKQLSAAGWLGTHVLEQFVRESNVEKRWAEAFGKKASEVVMEKINFNIYVYPCAWFSINFYRGNFKACFKLAKPVMHSPLFWKALPRMFWKNNPLVKNHKKILKSIYYLLKFNLLFKKDIRKR